MQVLHKKMLVRAKRGWASSDRRVCFVVMHSFSKEHITNERKCHHFSKEYTLNQIKCPPFSDKCINKEKQIMP
jgi:hypothetical protein